MYTPVGHTVHSYRATLVLTWHRYSTRSTVFKAPARGTKCHHAAITIILQQLRFELCDGQQWQYKWQHLLWTLSDQRGTICTLASFWLQVNSSSSRGSSSKHFNICILPWIEFCYRERERKRKDIIHELHLLGLPDKYLALEDACQREEELFFANGVRTDEH